MVGALGYEEFNPGTKSQRWLDVLNLKAREPMGRELPAGWHAIGIEHVSQGIGKKRDDAGPLQGFGQHPLVSSAGPGLATWLDLRPVGQVTPKLVDIFIVDGRYVADAKAADLSPLKESTPTSSLGAATATCPSTWRRPGAEGRSRARSRRCRLPAVRRA